MATFTVYFLIHILRINLTIFNLSKGESDLKVTFNYTLTTKWLSSMSLSDPITSKQLNQLVKHEVAAVENYLKYVKSALHTPREYKILKNFHSTLKLFMDAQCLIVIKKIEGIDLFPKQNFLWFSNNLTWQLATLTTLNLNTMKIGTMY